MNTEMSITAEIRSLREELCTLDRQCACSFEDGWADGPLHHPCVHHQQVNAKLDVLDELARRLGLAEVTSANEPDIARDRDGNRGPFHAWPAS